MFEGPGKRKTVLENDMVRLWDGGSDPEHEKAGNFQKLEKERFFLRAFRRNQPRWHLDLIPVKPILDLGLPVLQDNTFMSL